MGRAASATINHDFIRKWVEERGGKPAAVKGRSRGGEPGILRIDFPGFSGEGTLQEISWDAWFDAFDKNHLAFLYQERLDDQLSRFNKLVDRDSVELTESGFGTSKRGPERSKHARMRAQAEAGERRRPEEEAKGEDEEEGEELEVEIEEGAMVEGKELEVDIEEEGEELEGEEEGEEAEETWAASGEEAEEAWSGEEEESEESEEAWAGEEAEEAPRSRARAASSSRVDLNTADLEELTTIEGIGRTRAQNLLDYRETRGGFQSIDELANVPGFNATLVEKVSEQATVGRPASQRPKRRAA